MGWGAGLTPFYSFLFQIASVFSAAFILVSIHPSKRSKMHSGQCKKSTRFSVMLCLLLHCVVSLKLWGELESTVPPMSLPGVEAVIR